MTIRVLHVNDEPLTELGGVSRYLDRLLPAQRELGLQVSLLTSVAAHSGLGRVRDFWSPAARRAVQRAAYDFNADVVHLHNVLRESSVSVTALRQPVVMSVHDPKILGETHHASAFIGAIDRHVKSPWERFVATRQVSMFAAVSEELRDRCVAAGLAPVQWLPGPTLLPSAELHPASSCRSVVYLGRLAADKGVRQLLDAWRLIDTDLVLRVIGDGPERSSLAHDAPPGVVFEGPLSERGVSEALATTRLVVLPYQPSLRQASSLAALEAASHGRPVVVGDDPAVVEILRRLGGGTAVDASDVSLLAAAVSSYLVDGVRCDLEGAALQASVLQDYSPSAVARRSLALYDEVLGR